MSQKRPVLTETAPSQVREDEPTFSRAVGLIGWCVAVVGAVVALANIYSTTPRLIPEWIGWLLVMLGLFGGFFHAAIENDRLIRQILSGLAVIGIIGGLGVAIAKSKNWPVGLLAFIPGELLLALLARREQDPLMRILLRLGLFALGVVMALTGIVGICVHSPWIAGPGSVMTVLGLLTVATAIPMMDADLADYGHYGAIGLGIVGVLAVVYGIGRSTVPFVLNDWRGPVPSYALPAAILGLSALVLGLAGRFVLPGALKVEANSDSARQLRSAANIAVMVGVAIALIGVTRLFATDVLRNTGWGSKTPAPYLVPNGVVQVFAGLMYLVVFLLFWSEHPVVVLTRREFTTFFVSPIGYMVMLGFSAIGAMAYAMFVLQITERTDLGRPLEEPIVQEYIIGILPVFAVMVAVPLLTMRSFSEESRTGALEVLLTAPVADWHVVVSKFIAVHTMFMVLWIPWLLFLLGLRLEAGKPFDFRPLLGFCLAMFATGSGFIAMGLFFSSLTKNQIVAAALAFMGMIVLISLYFLGFMLKQGALGFLGIGDKAFDALKTAMKTMSFIDMWIDAMRGKVWLKDVAIHLSAAVMWLFMTVKVLESRRWK